MAEDDETEDEGGEQGKKPKRQARRPAWNDSVESTFQRYLDKYGGDAELAARNLFNDNHGYRTRAQSAETRAQGLEDDLDAIEEKLKAYEAFDKLGKKPEEIAAVLTEYPKVKDKLATYERAEALGAIAEAVGVKLSVLQKLDRLDGGHTYEKVTEKIDDKDVTVVKVRPNGSAADAQPVKFQDFAKQQWPEFENVLFTGTSAGNESSNDGEREAQGGQRRSTNDKQAQGGRFVRSGAGGSGGSSQKERDPSEVATSKYDSPFKRKAASEK